MKQAYDLEFKHDARSFKNGISIKCIVLYFTVLRLPLQPKTGINGGLVIEYNAKITLNYMG